MKKMHPSYVNFIGKGSEGYSVYNTVTRILVLLGDSGVTDMLRKSISWLVIMDNLVWIGTEISSLASKSITVLSKAIIWINEDHKV